MLQSCEEPLNLIKMLYLIFFITISIGSSSKVPMMIFFRGTRQSEKYNFMHFSEFFFKVNLYYETTPCFHVIIGDLIRKIQVTDYQ